MNTYIVQEQPLFVKLALVKHTLYPGRKTVNLDEFNHESVRRVQSSQFLGLGVAIYIEFANLGHGLTKVENDR